MTGITEAYLTRHYQGIRGARDAALLDIAQDHALFHLHRVGLFDRGLVFKGGTALRKYRAGSNGRFSTDLDLAAADETLAIDTLAAIENVNVGGFRFQAVDLGDDGRRATLIIDTPFGHPDIAAKIELARHPLSLPAEVLAPVPVPIQRVYGFEVPTVPVIAQAEAVAEKLARFRRVDLARDLYDLAWYAGRPFDQALVRRLWVLKTYRDIVHDKRGDKPIDPEQVLHVRKADGFRSEDIGYLTGKVDILGWMATVARRFAFLRDLDDQEQQWCACNPRDDYSVTQALATIADWTPEMNDEISRLEFPWPVVVVVLILAAIIVVRMFVSPVQADDLAQSFGALWPRCQRWHCASYHPWNVPSVLADDSLGQSGPDCSCEPLVWATCWPSARLIDGGGLPSPMPTEPLYP
ncbi:MAG: nucleotidyl transferase AbiEii/AbiGii toxin family protein [Propionibacteriaceae bacterium]|nr:nucleotidyl transferase AbiEii/AbiGii toxin family protein [Propionibacteriaceae bacterium]